MIKVTPDDGALDYSEGLHMGYRAWLQHHTPPAYWFGHGLGYTDIALTAVDPVKPLTAGYTAPSPSPSPSRTAAPRTANRSSRSTPRNPTPPSNGPPAG